MIIVRSTGTKPYFTGDKPAEVDCAVFGVLAQGVWAAPGSVLEAIVNGMPWDLNVDWDITQDVIVFTLKQRNSPIWKCSAREWKRISGRIGTYLSLVPRWDN